MRTSVLRTIGPVAKLAVAGSLLITALAGGPRAQQHEAHAAPAPVATRDFATSMAEATAKMHAAMAAAKPTGDPDRDFLVAMIPHHEGAVEMARLVLVHGRDPLVRRLAEDIIAGQQSEIAAMRARLEVLENAPNPNPAEYPALGGTRGMP
jgi:uncharacterized protein (DUF305 family)